MQLGGVIPANVLPFDEDGNIDENAYRHHLEWLLATPGIGGLTCNGHAAEVATLDREERSRAVGIAVETAAGQVPVVCGVYADDERDGVDKARWAESDGADALLLMPPNCLAYEGSLDRVVDYFAYIAESVDVPLVAFVYPESTGLHYSPALLERICAIDSVVAVKEWSLDIEAHEQNLKAVRSAQGAVSLLTSFSTHLLSALAVGADGILSGHGSVIASLQVQLFDEVSRSDLFAARETYRRVQRLTRVVYRDPMPNMYSRMKEQLCMLGHPLSPTVRAPLRQVSSSERHELREALTQAGFLPLSRQTPDAN